MPIEPNFGPHLEKSNIKAFSDISQRAFSIYHEKITPELMLNFPLPYHLFVRKIYLAETTSFSIRLLSSWGISLQALALTRIRLEQTIVCSYLIHEDPQIGLEPFLNHVPINEYLNTFTAISDNSIATNLTNIDLTQLQIKAIKAQENFTPGFDINNDRFERKWTKLDLRAMAHRRDELTASRSKISSDSLERDYMSLYKLSSSIIHSDCSAFSFRYLDVFTINPGKQTVLLPLPSWPIISVAFTSHYDFIQVFEVLKLFEIDCENELKDLRKNWLASVKKYI